MWEHIRQTQVGGHSTTFRTNTFKNYQVRGKKEKQRVTFMDHRKLRSHDTKCILVSWNRKKHISSVQSLSRVRLFATPWIAAHQAPGVHPDSCPSSQWCHPAISSSVVPFSSCPQSLLASESFPVSQLFTWGGQSTGVSASASFPPKKSQGWSPSEWTGWISLQSKGLSGVFSNTTVLKHQFFGAQPSSQTNSHIDTWPQEKP